MKRKGSAQSGGETCKKARRDVDRSFTNATHPVLQRLYPEVLTLRQYLLSKLPSTSKNRQRKISQLGRTTSAQGISQNHLDTAVVQLLDSTLVCTSSVNADTGAHTCFKEEREKDIRAFTQQRSQSTPGSTFNPGYYMQSEIVDFVIWRLFKRSTAHKPTHLLCHGFQRTGTTRREQGNNGNPSSSIPNLQERQPNSYRQTLKEPVWCRLHALLGQGGDRIIIDMLLESSIFIPLNADMGNYYQLSGMPISEIKSDGFQKSNTVRVDVGYEAVNNPSRVKSECKTAGTITFVRSRMLYAKAALNAKGGVRFGMRHIHVLNRFPSREDKQQTIHIMRYIFPRQFGLHNVFTSKVDPRETAMPFMDYTLREKDIYSRMCRELGSEATNAEKIVKWKQRTPKRLRGDAVRLVEKLRVRNQRCSYMEMLRHYAPIEGMPLSTKPEWRKSVIQPVVKTTNCEKKNLACPAAHVSAFCRAVISKVIPEGFWGNEHNKSNLMYWVDQFIELRRFESVNLHQVTQNIQITKIAWLRPPGHNDDTKISNSDMSKRTEMFLEFVYWLFDSFLIPLVRTNFHVTESNAHRNRLFYFRHDVWRLLAEPALLELRTNMFEEMPTESTERLLSARQLGFSNIRLLPKRQGFRTIMNLKRRQQVMRYGTTMLGRSINAVMTPAFNAITYEKSLRPEQFGCSLFSVGDMFPRLASFKASLRQRGLGDTRLYFAKVDVQACFDTIPQSRLLRMIDSLMSIQAYKTGKHVEISPLPPLQRLDGKHVDPMPLKKYIPHTDAATDITPFNQLVQDRLAGKKANTIFVNTDLQRHETKDDLMQLLQEHIERNVVKIGKRFYRQKTGIPQGSVLSSILCNFFYAQLERDVLGFALDDDSLLLRLLDDFLLISINEEYARRFVRVMHNDHPEYGVVIKPSKSLANFDVMTEEGTRISTSGSDGKFPYCGVCIDTTTLEISKKTERPTKTGVEDSLTVDLTKMPGQTFHRKALK